MRHNLVCLLAALAAALVSGCYGAESLAGNWHSQTTNDIPGTKGLALVQKSIEFSKEGSFHMNDVIRAEAISLTNSIVGTYKVLDTNHLVLEVMAAPAVLTNKNSFPLSYSLTNDELVLQDWTSLSGQVTKYRRVVK